MGYSVAANAFYERGKEYFDVGDYDNALLSFGKAIKQERGFWEAYRENALIYIGAKKYSKAIKSLDNAIKINDNNAGLYYLRGSAYSLYDKESDEESGNYAMNEM